MSRVKNFGEVIVVEVLRKSSRSFNVAPSNLMSAVSLKKQ